MSTRISPPSAVMDSTGERVFTPDEEEQKQMFYERMSPRRRKFIDKIGFAVWDPFEAPKEPMDIRVDVTKRTTQQLVREFLQTIDKEQVSNGYSRGALECAIGLVNRDEKYLGIFDFCLWYHELLSQDRDRFSASHKKEQTQP